MRFSLSKQAKRACLKGMLVGVSTLTAVAAASAQGPICIAPANPGGGFDLTCKLLQGALADAEIFDEPMQITYMPGGVGVVAINRVVVQRPAEPNTVIAASTGTWVRMAQEKFGEFGVNDVRWLGAIAADYAMIAVRADSPYRTLSELLDALQADPGSVVFGGGGSVGSMDWMKVAQINERAGIEADAFRFVAFEGGGDVYSALLGGHVDAVSGEVSESKELLRAGKIRILAVLADKRLDGFPDLPTAKEQGFDLSWPIVRGFYVGPEVSDEAYDRWVGILDKLQASKAFQERRDRLGLFAYDLSGAPFQEFAVEEDARFTTTARKFGLRD